MNDQFLVKMHFVIFTTQIAANKKYILSTNKDTIELPFKVLSVNDLSNIDQSITSSLKEYIFVNELELIPQLINLHSLYIENKEDNKNILNTIYGFIVGYTDNINNEKCSWVEFDYLNPIPYSNLIFEVTQKLT